MPCGKRVPTSSLRAPMGIPGSGSGCLVGSRAIFSRVRGAVHFSPTEGTSEIREPIEVRNAVGRQFLSGRATALTGVPSAIVASLDLRVPGKELFAKPRLAL